MQRTCGLSRSTARRAVGGRGRFAVVVAGLAVLLAACVRPSAPPAPSASARSAAFSTGVTTRFGGKDMVGFGMAPNSIYPSALPKMAAMGGRWVRTDFYWPQIETARGVYNWSFYDGLVATAAANGLKVIATLDYGAWWDGSAVNGSDKHLPVHPDWYGEYAAAVVSRYASRNPGTVVAVEIWNEPNGAWAAAPVDRGGAYANLLKIVYPMIKNANPSVTVIGGVEEQHGTDDGVGTTPATFLTNVYNAGAAGSFDAWCLHPYSSGDLTYALGQMNTLHNIMAAHGDGAKQIFSTELGSASAQISQPQQVALDNAYIQAFNQPWFGPMTFWIQDFQTYTFGVYDANWNAKQAVAGLTSSIAGLPG